MILFLLFLPILRTRQLIQQLNHGASWPTRHTTLCQIRIDFVLASHPHTGDIEMDPIHALDELVEERGRFAWAPMTLTLIVHVVRFVTGHLFREEFPQWHTPYAIARNYTRFSYLGP